MFQLDMPASDVTLNESLTAVTETFENSQAKRGFSCKECNANFSRKDNLKRHMIRTHKREHFDEEDVNKKNACIHPGCSKVFYHKTKLIQHIEEDHSVSLQTENIVFKTMQDFLKWKEQEEQNNYVFFSKCSGTTESKKASYSYYACQRDGTSQSHRKATEPPRKTRRRNRKGLVRMGTLCPARLQVRTLHTGGVIVKYIKTHSHPIKFEDTQHQPTPLHIKEEIKNKIIEGATVKEIHQSLLDGAEEEKNSTDCWTQKKRHLVGERFIREMRRQLKNVIPSKEVIFQLREITGASPEQIKDAYVASNGDVQKAVNILTGNQTIGTSQPQSQVHLEQDLVAGKETSNKEVIEISDDKDDDLAKAIELSLREAHGAFASAISDEDREISKALEASLVDSRGGNKRKRGNLWMSFIDPENPHDRERKNGVPVGLKNIGNTCWFSAVIQSLFHLPKFRNLVLNCGLSSEAENLKDHPKLAFLLELQKLFSLLLQSQRKYVDPAKPIEILEEAIRGTGKENAGDQQDVSEFNHVLLDWLEEAFKSAPNRDRKHFFELGVPDFMDMLRNYYKKESWTSASDQNPIADLFYGRYSVNGCYDGKEVKNEENFGALPLHVRGHDHLYDGLDDAMVNNEIKTNNQDASANSTQEHWFTHLPAVLTFELSRFIFNQQLSKAEKIHDPFRIEQTIYLARYMECNKDLTREKRRKVDKLKRKRRELLSKLDKYTSFGTGPKKAPIMTTLDSTLAFIRKGLTREDQETPMMISPSSSPSSSTHATVAEYPETSPILAAAENVQGPAPKSMTSEEGNTIIDCLQRWRDEIQLEAETLRKGIEFIDRELQQAYDEESFMQVPYRLHAILVHEGQANGGHYWSYIFDSNKNVWRKFNDITVTETTWEDVQKESIGGYRNTSAYCLLYVDANRTDLFELDAMEEEMPPIVRDYVELDERKFREEIEEWDAKQRKKEKSTEATSTTTTTTSSNNKENTPMSVDPKPNSAKPKTTRELSLDEQLDDLYSEKCGQMASHISGLQLLDADLRVDNIVLYFYTSKAPNHVIHQGFLEWLTGINSPNERILLLQKHAKWKLKNLEDNAKQNEQYQKWKDYFKEFIRAHACFVAGAEAFYSQRYREALPYFVHSMDTNDRLSNAEFKPSCMEKTIVSHYRRQCLLYVNEEASKQFESINIFEMDEGATLMKELVLPSLSSLSETQDADDLIVAETVRGRWCAFVGNPDIQGRKNEILEEILMGLVDSSGRSSMKLPTLRGPITGPDLYKRYARIMEKAKRENISSQPMTW